jgi:L-histidine N-alpha-methyltransferase
MTSQPIFDEAREPDEEGQRRRTMLAEVREGLARTPRELSPKFFYDERGSRLFEEITALPEYYLTRAEREILVARAGEIVAREPRTLVELGAGSATKTRILLTAMRARVSEVTYVPVDVSAEFLDQTSAALEEEMPGLRVRPVVADLTDAFELPSPLAGPRLFAFLGSTIGNFGGASAIGLLRRVRSQMHAGDQFLLGTDLRKDRETLEAAYDDSAGVTAEFNRNVLLVLNEELGADFDPAGFEHVAFYNEEEHRIEMHLRSSRTQRVHIPGLETLRFREDEAIRTEVSYKYDSASVAALANSANLTITQWFTDRQQRFALSVLEPRA